MRLAQGFAGERISVLPRPIVHEALAQPVTARLLVTDCGYFPAAGSHQRTRPAGSLQTVVIICTDGQGWCRLDGPAFQITPGEALVIPAGTPHTYGAAIDDPWTIWWMHLAGSDLAEMLGALELDPEHPVIPVQDAYRATLLVDEVLRQMERDNSVNSRQHAAGAAWHLLALLVSGPAKLPATRVDAIQQAKEYLQERVETRVSIAEMARLAGLSPSHFAAMFRKATGLGVLEYQIGQRMARARELLDTTDLPVSSIARALGYRDPFYFSRHFRLVHGVTASQYRNQHKG